MNKRLIALPLAIVILLVGWLVLRDGNDERNVITASGTVEATEADLGFQAGGRVMEVVPREGDVVQQGDVIARIEQDELRARRDAAAAQLQAARAQLAELEHGARPAERRQAQSTFEAARRRMLEAQASLNRTRRLYEGGAASREALDHAETAYTVARAQADQAQQQQSLVEEGPRAERIEAQRALVRQAEASLNQVDAALDNATVRAPFAGVVTMRHREPGEAIAPGLPVITLLNTADRWVRIYVREDRVGRLRLGQSAQIRSDSHPDSTYAGRITYISSQAEFTPRNVQTAEDRVKLVYAVKVAITGDRANHLKPGVPADVTLRVEQ